MCKLALWSWKKNYIFAFVMLLGRHKKNFQGSLIRKLLDHGGCFNWQAAIKALMIAPLVYSPSSFNLRSWEITQLPPLFKYSQRTWGHRVDGKKSCTTWDAPEGVDSEEKPVSLQNARRMHPQKFLKFCFPPRKLVSLLGGAPTSYISKDGSRFYLAKWDPLVMSELEGCWRVKKCWTRLAEWSQTAVQLTFRDTGYVMINRAGETPYFSPKNYNESKTNVTKVACDWCWSRSWSERSQNDASSRHCGFGNNLSPSEVV